VAEYQQQKQSINLVWQSRTNNRKAVHFHSARHQLIYSHCVFLVLIQPLCTDEQENDVTSVTINDGRARGTSLRFRSA
jgi:hypothetical protein